MPLCCCWKGHRRYYEDVKKELDCSDIIEEIYPESGDPVVDKFGYGAFHNTNLEDLLKARGAETNSKSGTTLGGRPRMQSGLNASRPFPRFTVPSGPCALKVDLYSSIP